MRGVETLRVEKLGGNEYWGWIRPEERLLLEVRIQFALASGGDEARTGRAILTAISFSPYMTAAYQVYYIFII